MPPTLTPLASTLVAGSRITIVPSWTPTAFSIPTATSTATRTPLPTATSTPRPTQPLTSGPILAPNIEISAQDLADPAHDLLHNLIVFTSDNLYPFQSTGIGRPDSAGDVANIKLPQLWGFSPDGQRAGRLSFADRGFNSYMLPGAGVQPLFVQYGIYYNHPAIRSIPVPAECLVVTCQDFQFSPDGRYLTLGVSTSDWHVILQDTSSGAYDYLPPDGVEKEVQFVADSRILVMVNYGEYGEVLLYDPSSQTSERLGTDGDRVWNQDGSRLAIQAQTFDGFGGAVWGLNLATGALFLQEPDPQAWGMDNGPVWAPGGQYLLYQHRSLEFDGEEYTFDSSRKIMIVDTLSGKREILLGDDGYDYYFSCAWESNECGQWSGDWVQVYRTPFEPQSVAFGPDFFGDPVVLCRGYGLQCTNTKLFGLNWRTGELLAWQDLPDLAIIPAASQEPAQAYGPDLTSQPVYQSPDGNYAFYTGTDGVSLWMVPLEGDAEVWVLEGYHFMYLP
ncbi:MAG: hypothetical protein JW726_03075 [Anaerolineales bacterium]|nr:hypothetical protein [Anaerolineales bacterium]